MSDSPSPIISVTIPSEAPFLSAIDQYAEENKPDPLSLKQLKGLSVEWENRTTTLPAEEEDFAFDPSHVLCGTLSITGEYMVARLNIVCAWTFDESDSKYGNLSYKCCASATMLPKQSKSKDKDKASAVEEKIRSKMQKRLKNDAYISKLLIKSSKEETGESSSSWPVFASAEIRSLPTDLEERVDVSQPMAEAIKRAIWSSAESNLDIVDLILHFPSLPTSMHKDTISVTTELANRAKLRLLEDAMLDACEQEGEDQILEDLTIIDGDKKKNEEGDTGEESRENSRSKRSRH